MDIAAWLRELGLERYEQAFQENEIDAAILPKLTADDLKDIGITAVGHRRRLLEAIAALAEPASARQAEPSASSESARRARPAEAERRQLTVLFSDLVGSTELSARLDPEDMGRVIRAYQTRCAEVIRRWDGHVAKYMGDGVLVYFGYPQAHEDDAERAVRAALDLTAAVAALTAPDGAPLAARIGIATGLVMVGDLIGEGATQKEAVVGETPNLAARLQGLAEPGTVVIAGGTRRLVGELFELADLGEQRLKGFAKPIRAWRAVGATPGPSRFEALRGARRTPLVERGRELEVLAHALDQAAAGQGQIVAAVGEPGVGKSRLFDAFLRSPQLDRWPISTCSCLSYASGTPWLPVIDLIKGRFGIEDQDDQEDVIEKVEKGLVPLGELAESTEPALRALLGLAVEDFDWQSLNPPQRRRRILNAAKNLLLLESERQPLALVVEDLHWADDETIVFLDGLVESLPTSRILLLVNYRPEFQHTWTGRSYYAQLRIDPLDVEGASQLLGALIGNDPELEPLKERLIERTVGNPLFLEEAVRDLAETGVLSGETGAYQLVGTIDDRHLPDTVQAIIAARIDRLPQESRLLLQRAAVIGRDVPLALLSAVVEIAEDELRARLVELLEAEMLQEVRSFSELEYAFKHALTHEVAYRSLLREARVTLHRRVGEEIEAIYPERLGELAEALSGHFHRGQVWSKAALYALDAAEKAKSRYAYDVGMRFAERAREGAAQDLSLEQEWILANVLLGDLASLIDDLELANRSYDLALTKSKDSAEQRWIGNKRHEPRFAVRDGAKIAYYVHGSGDETILFMSQIGHGLAAWQPVVERLCQEFRIITIDARGTGRSDPLAGLFLAKDHGLDVAAVVHHATDAPIVAVGTSRGGISVAHATANAPELFKKLVLVGTPTGQPNSLSAHLLALEREALAQGDFERAARLFVPTVVSEPGTEDLIEQRVKGYLSLPRETILNFYESRPPEYNVFIPALQRIGLPVLVMHGTEDKRVSFEDARHLAEVIPSAQLYPFEGRGHLCQVTATQEFCDVLRRFVTTGSATPALQIDADTDSFSSTR